MRQPQLAQYSIDQGLNASAGMQPEFTGQTERHSEHRACHDTGGIEGRLVVIHTFTSSGTWWEMHPIGAEVILRTAGNTTLVQEQLDGILTRNTVAAGASAVNLHRVWHTGDIENSATFVSFADVSGTQIREHH